MTLKLAKGTLLDRYDHLELLMEHSQHVVDAHQRTLDQLNKKSAAMLSKIAQAQISMYPGDVVQALVTPPYLTRDQTEDFFIVVSVLVYESRRPALLRLARGKKASPRIGVEIRAMNGALSRVVGTPAQLARKLKVLPMRVLDIPAYARAKDAPQVCVACKASLPVYNPANPNTVIGLVHHCTCTERYVLSYDTVFSPPGIPLWLPKK